MTDHTTSKRPDLIAAKMAVLGKMSAALAHEMNNPASAAQRAASDLGEIVRRLTDLGRTFMVREHAHSNETLSGLLDEAIQMNVGQRGEPVHRQVDPITRSEHEEQLVNWLERRGVPESWRLGPDLLDAGLKPEWLEALEAATSSDEFVPTVTWIAYASAAARRVEEIVQSAARLTALVSAVKSYAYADKSPLQPVDVHEGIESTLVLLGHRLKGIELVRQYDRSLPPVPGHPAELSQVWTNLIDNASDVLQGTGTISITTSRQAEHALVEVADNGPGIPPDVLPHIFEPFFTTKTLGAGLGLGLDVSSRIVTERHGGKIEVQSVPGNTRFRVLLPLTSSDGR